MGDNNAVHDVERLKELQALPLERKIMITQTRIIEWDKHYNGNIYVAYSGGKDSTVLLDIARKVKPDIKAVFVNTGLEYPEIREFALNHDNVIEIRPRYGKEAVEFGKKPGDIITFRDTITYYGYPVISKEVAEAIDQARRIPGGSRWKKMHGLYPHKDNGRTSSFDHRKYLPVLELPVKISEKCCNITKKNPNKQFQKETGLKPILGTMTEESTMRKFAWYKTGCNAFDGKNPHSNPMAFWTNQDVLNYIQSFNIPICSVYGDVICNEKGKLECSGCKRTGCIFCAFGAHMSKKGRGRFELLKVSHPRQYEYCMDGGEFINNPEYDSSETNPDKWNPKQIWVPSSKGIGMAKLFDMLNGIFGKEFIRY